MHLARAMIVQHLPAWQVMAPQLMGGSVRPPERKADTMRRNALVATLAVLVGLPLIASFSGCTRPDLPRASTTGASHLFVWAGDADEEDSDFLAVIDTRRSAPTYGQVVATLPVGARATMPHHTEYEDPSNDILFANGWVAGRTFMIDLRDPHGAPTRRAVHQRRGLQLSS